ncbi:MAG: glycosyltransferase family 4 protein [Vicinamibacterales bacterium]
MRIVHLVTFLHGDTGRLVTDLAIRQRALGHDVTVVASETPAGELANDAHRLQALARLGVPVHLADSLHQRDFDANLAVSRHLAELFGPGAEPDVLHAHAAVPTFIARLFAGARGTRLPIVQTLHGWGMARTAGEAAWDVGLMNLADRVAVPSAHAAQRLASRGLPWARITVVPHGVDADATPFDDRDRALLARIREDRQRGAIVVVCPGRLEADGPAALAISAVARLGEQPRVRLVLVGEGDADDLRDRVRRVGLAATVHVHGRSAAPGRIAREADAVLVQARPEDDQWLPVLDAFRDGPVAVVGDRPALRDLVEDGVTGLTFVAGDAGALTGTLARLAFMAEEAREALRREARTRHRDTSSAAAMGGHYLHLYRLVCDARLRRAARSQTPAA